MPKYGIHHIALLDAIPGLLASGKPAARAAGDDLSNHPGMANLGTIGPDLLFWAPDYETTAKIYQLYKNYDAVRDLYDDIVQPFREIRDATVGHLKSTVGMLAPDTVRLIEHLVEKMRLTSEGFQKAVMNGLLAGVIDGANLVTDAASIPRLSREFFGLFEPPLQKGEDVDRWYWFDMLHYRKTGAFGQALVKNAKSAQARAYAYGYLSHIATDLIGHPYVNQIVGGPYRLQMQRHVTVENYMDTWKYANRFNENLNNTLFTRLGLPEKLPAEVGDLLHKSLADVYAGGAHPLRLAGGGFLSREQIDETYEILRKVLEKMQGMSLARPEEPFSYVADILADALKRLFEAPPSPPALAGACSAADIFAFGTTPASRACYEQFFKELPKLLEYIGKLMAWLASKVRDLLNLIVTSLLALPVETLLAQLYGMQLACYEIFQTARSVLALQGFIFPEATDVVSSHGRHLTTPSLCGLGGCSFEDVYPRRADSRVVHLLCPPASLELPETLSNPDDPWTGLTPDTFISGIPLDLGALREYAEAPDPSTTDTLNKKCKRIGNAVELTAFMIATAADSGAAETEKNMSFANWNLDGDRSYAAKTWTPRSWSNFPPAPGAPAETKPID